MFNLILFLIIIFLLIILSMVWPPDSPWAPWWRTNKKIARKACTLAEITNRDVVCELGSGDAGFLLTAVKEFQAKEGVGIEIDPLRVFISKILVKKNQLSNKIKIIKGDFFKQDLSRATVIFVYLVPKTLQKLKPKFLKELKPGVKIISFRYEINLPEVASDRKHLLHLYKIN